MKNTLKLCCGILVVLNLSCKEIRKKLLPSFIAHTPPIMLTVPPIGFVSRGELPAGALKTHVNMDSTIKANTAGAFGASAVTSILVKKIVINVLNPDRNNNLANFESARMRIYSNYDTAAADIAIIKFPRGYSDSVTVTSEGGPELSSFLRGSELGYNLYWRNRKTTNKFLKLMLSVTLSVQ